MLPELGGESFGDARQRNAAGIGGEDGAWLAMLQHLLDQRDRKSTRLNSSHLGISYAVFCLKKKRMNRTGRTVAGGLGVSRAGDTRSARGAECGVGEECHRPLCARETLGVFFLNDTAPTEIYPLSLHDALPISVHRGIDELRRHYHVPGPADGARQVVVDRKSTRLNSSHLGISYAVFCLKK